jgi:hypothetical protein
MMSGAYDDLGGRKETYAEALARWNASRTDVAMTEQQLADKIVRDRERMRQHDARFADGFITVEEQRLVSIDLARKMGHMPAQERGDGFDDDMDTGETD